VSEPHALGPAAPLTDLAAASVARGHGVPFGEALRTWSRVALNSFGGPAGQIAVMHRILVEEKRWVSEERFLHALSYCMLLPGPEAQELATYIGWLLHRTLGGLIMAAVVGVILNLAIWFSLHTLFATVGEERVGPLVLQVPAWATLDPAASAIALVAALATLRFRVGMLRLIAACAALGVLWRLFGPGG
jgi:chromate transport protein ChrA